MAGTLNLAAYLARVEYRGDLRPARDVLDALHLAHATHILFENVDVLLGRGVSLDLQAIQNKLVDGQRGGYCFEHNTLFAAVLREVGFTVTPLAARVRHRTTQVLPRTHMLLLVDLDGEAFVADVGFGGEGLLLPLPLRADGGSPQFKWTYRVHEEAPGRFAVQSLRDGAWLDLYAFTLEPQHPIDFEMANHFTSTHPGSRFVQMLTVQKLAREARTILRNTELTVDRGDRVTITDVEGDLLVVLADTFGLRLPAGTQLPDLRGVTRR
jgi:N-hydroxyarylamine O-acetyltransferase